MLAFHIDYMFTSVDHKVVMISVTGNIFRKVPTYFWSVVNYIIETGITFVTFQSLQRKIYYMYVLKIPGRGSASSIILQYY